MVDVKYVHTNFGGCGHSSFGYIATFHNCQISLYSQWSLKNLIVWNWLTKFMQVWIDVKFMHTNFDGCRHSGFRDIATFKNDQISLSDHGLFDASVALVPTLLPPYLRTLTSTLPSLRVRSPINLPQLLLCYHVFIYSILFHSVSFFFHYSPWSL